MFDLTGHSERGVVVLQMPLCFQELISMNYNEQQLFPEEKLWPSSVVKSPAAYQKAFPSGLDRELRRQHAQ